MYFLKSIENDKAFYLINKNEFIVGRKNCDILIENDSSISRHHAKIIIKDGDKITLQDLKSKYKTFVNGNEVDPDVELQLKEKDKIQFGGLRTIYTLHKLHLITTATQLSSGKKEALKKQIALLQGKYQENWDSNCTHLTLEKVSLTVKVLHALLEDKPTVIPEFWANFVKNVNKNLPPPNIQDYNNPPLVEALLNVADFKSCLPRKGLFKGKTFVFASEKEKKQVETLIEKAGGSAISWEKNPIDIRKINQSSQEFLIMQSVLNIEDKSYKEILKYILKENKRTIPMQDIAMAIIHGSCEKDCNPDFNRGQTVFGKSKNKEPTQHQLLVQNTQTQNTQDCSENHTVNSKVIPETVDCVMATTMDHGMTGEIIDVFDGTTAETSKSTQKTQKTVKRPADKVEANNPFKKIKLEKAEKLKRQASLEVQTVAIAEPVKVEEENSFRIGQTQKRKASDDSNESSSAKEFLANPFWMSAKRNRSNQSVDDEMPSTSSGKPSNSVKESSVPPVDNNSKDERIFYSKSSIKDLDYTWSSKEDAVVVKKEEEQDVDLKAFIKLFEDTMVTVSNLTVIPKEHKDEVDFSIDSGVKNVKKFKKVKHPHPQTTVISDRTFTVSSCDNTIGIKDTRRPKIPDSDDEEDSRPKAKSKRSGKSFFA